MRKCARVLYNRKDDINSKFFWFFLCCGSGMFIWDPELNFSILDPGSKRHRIPDPDPQQ
jgi:hypothetical protein